MKTGRFTYRPVTVIDTLEFPYATEPGLRMVKVRHTQGVRTGKAQWMTVSSLHECEPKRGSPTERQLKIMERQENAYAKVITLLKARGGTATVSELVRDSGASGWAIWWWSWSLARQKRVEIVPDESKNRRSKWVVKLVNQADNE